MAKLKTTQPKPVLVPSLVDNIDIVVTCSDCDKPIAIIKEVDRNTPVELTLKVRCCYCKGTSFPVPIKGHFFSSGYHTIKEDGVNTIDFTEIEFDTMDENNICWFNTRQVKNETKKV